MRIRIATLSLTALFACLAAVPSVADDRPDEMKVSTAFSASTYLDHVKYLSGDELGGRGTGTPGLRKAAEYVAGLLEQAGCEPAGDDGSFFQNFEISGGKQLDQEGSSFEVEGFSRKLKFDKDWRPLPFSASDTVEGPLAFVGYGIEADDFGYNDYEDFDVEGKVLLILRYEPRSEDEDDEFGGSQRSRHSLYSTKARRAVEHGALAILIANARGDDDELYPFRSVRRQYGLPMLSITRKTADRLLKKAGLPSCKKLEKQLERDRKPLSADMKGLSARVSASLKPKMIQTRNVVAMLPGDGSTDEIIVVGAHYDHLGTRERDGKKVINNGADDNASGTAGIVELARVFGAGPKLRRNILFMTFSAEERGLLGSRHFVKNPTIDLKKVRAMLNMDMIGRLSQDKFEIWGTDTAEEFEELVERAAAAADIEYTAPDRSGGIFRRSDHFNFFRNDIPILFPYTGKHDQYHRPEDDWELIDSEGAVKVLQMAHLILGELANMEDGPTFLKDAPKKETKPARAAAKVDADDDEESTPAMPRVAMGIMPSYSDDGKKGMLVDGLIEKGPAQKAGIKENDRIVKIGKNKVDDIYGYMTALADLKPGDKVKVVVLRGEKEVTVEVKLGKSTRRGDDDDG